MHTIICKDAILVLKSITIATIFKDIFGHAVRTFQDLHSSREVLLVFMVLCYRLFSYRLSELVALSSSEMLNTTTVIANARAVLERVETFLKHSTIANKKEFSQLVDGADRKCCLLSGFWSSARHLLFAQMNKTLQTDYSFQQGKETSVVLVRITMILVLLFGYDKLLQGRECSTVWPRWQNVGLTAITINICLIMINSSSLNT